MEVPARLLSTAIIQVRELLPAHGKLIRGTLLEAGTRSGLVVGVKMNAAILSGFSAFRTSNGPDARGPGAHRANARASTLHPSANSARRATGLGLEGKILGDLSSGSGAPM